MSLFADDSSTISYVKGACINHEKLIKDLETISLWVYQWKMT